MKRSLFSLLVTCAALCTGCPSPAPLDASLRQACHAAAIVVANQSADDQCAAFDDWNECPESKAIEAQLLADLKACDGDK